MGLKIGKERKKQMKAMEKATEKRLKGMDVSQRVQFFLDTCGDRFLRDKSVAKSYGFNPIRLTPKTIAKARKEYDRITESIELNIARLGGSLNNRRLYLTKEGTVTRVAPKPKEIPVEEKKGNKLDLSKRKKLLEERESKPKTGRSATVLGHPVTAIIRWMGKNKWKKSEAAKVVERLAEGPVAPNTIPTALNHGKRGYRSIPKLTKKQIELLNKERKRK